MASQVADVYLGLSGSKFLYLSTNPVFSVYFWVKESLGRVNRNIQFQASAWKCWLVKFGVEVKHVKF